jgi:hypothetical protein
MAKVFPIIGEAYTFLESAACAGVGAFAAVSGDYRTAKQCFDAADNAWVEYTETNLIAGSINVLVCDQQKNYSKRNRIQKKLLRSWSNTADAIPVVGKFDVVFDFVHC